MTHLSDVPTELHFQIVQQLIGRRHPEKIASKMFDLGRTSAYWSKVTRKKIQQLVQELELRLEIVVPVWKNKSGSTRRRRQQWRLRLRSLKAVEAFLARQ